MFPSEELDAHTWLRSGRVKWQAPEGVGSVLCLLHSAPMAASPSLAGWARQPPASLPWHGGGHWPGASGIVNCRSWLVPLWHLCWRWRKMACLPLGDPAQLITYLKDEKCSGSVGGHKQISCLWQARVSAPSAMPVAL